MIASNMKYYPVVPDIRDGYGQSSPNWSSPLGLVKMALYITDFDTQRNISFSSSNYVGLASKVILNGDGESVTVGRYVVAEVPDKLGQLTTLIVNSVYRQGRYYQIFLSDAGYTVPDGYLEDLPNLLNAE